MYTQLAREGVVLTQDGDTELSYALCSRRVAARGDSCKEAIDAARGDSCKEAIGEINLPFLPLSVPLYINPSLIRGTPSYKMYPNRRVNEDNQQLL